jgi:outer membrane biosynthesis protein TonB
LNRTTPGLRAAIITLLLTLAATAAAQAVDPRDGNYALNQDGTMPAYIVPVLRLVSSTHVEPTTGLVLSADGLVLVPLDFASEGDEIIVLDGGTDIVRNGRPAHLKDFFPAEGLRILSVPGLRRDPAPFSSERLTDGAGLELTAFPPAERIAEGDPPLHTPATAVVFGKTAEPAVSGETPLPNVTGPLLDECGNVAAYSLAHDVQDMSSHPGTRYKWRSTLLGVMARLRISPAPTACREPAPDPVVEEPAPPESTTEPPPEPVEPEPEQEESTQDAEPVEEPAVEPQEAEETLDLDILPPYEPTDEAIDESDAEPIAPEAEEGSGGWLWLLAAALLAAGATALHFWRRRMSTEDGTAKHTDRPAIDPEPGATAPPDSPPADLVVALQITLENGSTDEIQCETPSRAINLFIGRGKADLAVPGAAVSRNHARLEGTAGALTITDLGSNNGTAVNGVPCLEGEILYVQEGDVITLGNVQTTLLLRKGEAG